MRRLVPAVLLALSTFAFASERGPRAVAPPDDAVVGASPIFRIALDDEAEGEAGGSPRLRLVLRSLTRGGRDYAFDRGRKRRGWNRGAPGETLFRPPRPLADGEYAWTVEAWDGTAWGLGSAERRLRVDSVPPGPVEGLEVRYDVEARTVELRWKPVTLDLADGPEYVARYHVYGTTRRGPVPLNPEHRLAVTETTRVVLSLSGLAGEGPGELRSFEVVAEDEAGNVAGVRR